MTRMLF